MRISLYVLVSVFVGQLTVCPRTTFANPGVPATSQPWGSVWLGPLPLQNERPYQAVFLHPPAEAPEVLPRGGQRLSAQLDVANDLLVPRRGPTGQAVHEDFETQRLKVVWSRGLGRKREWGISANLTARNGGNMDSFLEFYHHALGLPANGLDHPLGRDSLPKNSSILFFNDGKGHSVDQGSAIGIGDTTFWLKRQLRGGPLAASVRLATKIPTGSDGRLLGSGGLDLGAYLDARYAMNHRFSLFGGAGLAAFGHSSIPSSKTSGAQGNFGLEWRLGAKDSFVAQMDASTRTVTTGNPFADRAPVIGSLGFKHRAGDGRLLWLSMSENGDYTEYHFPATGNIAPDLTLTIGYQWTR